MIAKCCVVSVTACVASVTACVVESFWNTRQLTDRSFGFQKTGLQPVSADGSKASDVFVDRSRTPDPTPDTKDGDNGTALDDDGTASVTGRHISTCRLVCRTPHTLCRWPAADATDPQQPGRR